MPAVQTDLRNLPCKRIAGAFLRLAEEALLVDVGLTTFDYMEGNWTTAMWVRRSNE